MTKQIIVQIGHVGPEDWLFRSFLHVNREALHRRGLGFADFTGLGFPSHYDHLRYSLFYLQMQRVFSLQYPAWSVRFREELLRAGQVLARILAQTDTLVTAFWSVPSLPELLQALFSTLAPRSFAVTIVASYHHPVDTYEFMRRMDIWTRKKEASLGIARESLRYQTAIRALSGFLQKHAITELPASILWHDGSPVPPGQYGGVLGTFFQAAGKPGMEKGLAVPDVPLFASYEAARFAALCLPWRDARLPAGPGETLSLVNEYTAMDHAGMMAALLRADKDGDFTRGPLSTVAEREAVFEAGKPEVERLAEAHPELAAAIKARPFYDCSIPAVEQRELDAAAVDRILEFLDEEQIQSLAARLDSDAPILNPERRLIRERLYARLPGRSFKPLREEEPRLCILTPAYNHERYIGECIESVMAQRLDFPGRHVIVDDVSNDGTRDIIAAYARKHRHIWPVFLKEKYQHSGANIRGLFLRCRSAYAALCDGDDYFTEPDKLRTQAAYLDANPDCALCFHPVDVVYEGNAKRPRRYPSPETLPGGVKEKYILTDLFRCNFIQTNSVMYRWRFRDGLPAWFDPTLLPGDWYWHLLHAETGWIGFLDKVMAVYRRHENSLYHKAEISPRAIRLEHGMNELRTYEIVTRHFGRRFKKEVQTLANGVLADFTKHHMETGDDSLLRKACVRFPDFSREFLAALNAKRA